MNYPKSIVIIIVVVLMVQESFAQNLLHGYTPDVFPPDTVVNVGGENVIAQWFIAPVTGIIEDVYIMIGDTVQALDSIGFFRLHQSSINRERGPGVDYPLPPVQWGGYKIWFIIIMHTSFDGGHKFLI